MRRPAALRPAVGLGRAPIRDRSGSVQPIGNNEVSPVDDRDGHHQNAGTPQKPTVPGALTILTTTAAVAMIPMIMPVRTAWKVGWSARRTTPAIKRAGIDLVAQGGAMAVPADVLSYLLQHAALGGGSLANLPFILARNSSAMRAASLPLRMICGRMKMMSSVRFAVPVVVEKSVPRPGT